MRAQHAAVQQHQQHRRHGERKAQREGEDRDLDVVGEQIGGKAREKAVAAVIEHAAQQLGRGVGAAAGGQARRE